MMSKHLSLAAAVAAASLLAASPAVAQSSQNSKPSPYQGVSTPPPDSTILTSEEPPLPPPVATPAPVPVKPAAAAAATLSPTDAFVADEENNRVTLKPRPAEPASSQKANGDDGIVSYLPGPANALPAGTVFHATMLQTILADGAIPGASFRARLSQNLMYEGRIVVPAGSELEGKVLYAVTGRRISGSSVIHLRPDEFVLPNGKRYRLHAQVIDTQGSDTKVSGEGDIMAKSHGKRALVELAATTGGGALVGAAVGGPIGAAVGSTIGAGVSGARWFLDTPSVDIPEQSTLVFSLTEPMFLTPVSSPVANAVISQN